MAQQSNESACSGVEIVQTTISDPNGFYTLGFLEEGLYNLVIVKEGYQIEVDTNVEVLVGVNNENNDFFLTPLVQDDSFQLISGIIINTPDQDDSPQARILGTYDSVDAVIDVSPIDQEGYYFLYAPPGVYTIYKCAQGYDPIIDFNVIVTDEEITLE
jgi:hypothetical protein